MNNDQPLISYLQKLTSLGLVIDTVYDLGAYDGGWTDAMQRSVLPGAAFYLFEANPVYSEILKTRGFFVHIGVLSNPGRESVDFYNGSDSGDSYYKETTLHYDKKPSIVLSCQTLDSVVETNDLPIPQLIKIDTQGSELDILEGAKTVIGKTELIYLECPIINYNAQAPDIGEYISRLKSYGYIPTDIFEVHRAEEVLLQVDIMFIRADIREQLFGPNETIRPFAG